MKNLMISAVLLLAFLLGLPASCIAQYSEWKKDISFHGFEFKKVRFRKNGNESIYANGILKQKTIINGYPCHKNIILTKDGRLKFFILAEDFYVGGIEFQKETMVIIRKDKGILIHCLYEPTVQGYKIKRENYKRPLFMGSTNFLLYPRGRLKFFQPVEDIKIDGVWCKPSAVRGGVTLFENGKLKECTSAKEQHIQGNNIEKNVYLKFDENGKLFYAKKKKIFGD